MTSQRIVDVVFRAFSAGAASQGGMNNITFGNENFGYCETRAGHSGIQFPEETSQHNHWASGDRPLSFLR